MKKKFNGIKYVSGTAVVTIVVICLAVYLLPFIAYYEIESAIAAKDAGKLASYTDLNELRKNLKMQKGQRIIREWKKENGKNPTSQQSLVDLSIQWTGLTSDQAIDQAISTEGFSISLCGSRAERRKPDPIKPMSELSTFQLVRKLLTNGSFQYHSGSEFVASIKDDKNRYAEYFSFVFVREGLNWRLKKVNLPIV